MAINEFGELGHRSSRSRDLAAELALLGVIQDHEVAGIGRHESCPFASTNSHPCPIYTLNRPESRATVVHRSLARVAGPRRIPDRFNRTVARRIDDLVTVLAGRVRSSASRDPLRRARSGLGRLGSAPRLRRAASRAYANRLRSPLAHSPELIGQTELGPAGSRG
jgi:hypothetical protein